MDQAWLDELSELLRIPSISADSAHADDVRRAGEWIAEYVRKAGGEAELIPGERHPLAIGELRASTDADSAQTVIVYGHFDVQPPAPLDLWESDPFEPEIRGEWLYGRGIADDKGQLYALLKAAALLKAEGALPVNVRVCCDGEEESGGDSILDFIRDDERGGDVCVIFDSGMLARDVPALDVATRGVILLHVRVRTGERDLHSGMYGGAALNATHALIQALSAVLARDGRVPEPLRAGITPPTAEEREAWAQLTPGAEELAGQGAVPLDPKAGEEFYERTWADAATDVTGIAAGKMEPNTTIAAEAQAIVTVRLAPGQDVPTIRATLERLLREALPDGATLEVVYAHTARPGLIPPGSKAVELALDAFERALGVRPLLVRSGGTLPIVPVLADAGIPTILTGFSLPESNIHSPNERLLVEYVPKAVDSARELFTSFARLR